MTGEVAHLNDETCLVHWRMKVCCLTPHCFSFSSDKLVYQLPQEFLPKCFWKTCDWAHGLAVPVSIQMCPIPLNIIVSICLTYTGPTAQYLSTSQSFVYFSTLSGWNAGSHEVNSKTLIDLHGARISPSVWREPLSSTYFRSTRLSLSYTQSRVHGYPISHWLKPHTNFELWRDG